MKKLRYLPVFLALILLGSDGCRKFELNPDDLDLTINLDVLKTQYQILLYDAVGDSPISEENEAMIRITVHGPDSANVVDVSGNRKQVYSASAGRVILALDPYKAKPTEEDPVKFTVVAEVPGYLPSSVNIMTGMEGTYTERITLISRGSLPEGTIVKEIVNAGRADQGKLQDKIQAATDGNELSIEIPQGTILYDEKGNPLAGNLKVSMMLFSGNENSALELFPGSRYGDIDSAGTITTRDIDPIHFFNLEITDQNGTQMHTVDQGKIDLNLAFSETDVNPVTGEPIKKGDKILIYSFNPSTGQWTFDSEMVVQSEGSELRGRVSVTHFTWYYDQCQSWNPTFNIWCNSFYYLFTTEIDSLVNHPLEIGVNVYTWNTLLNNWRLKGSYYHVGYPVLSQTQTVEGLPSDRWIAFGNWRRGELYKMTFELPSNQGCIKFWNVPNELLWLECRPSIPGPSPYLLIRKIPLRSTVEATRGGARIHIRIKCKETGQTVVPTQKILGRYRSSDYWWCWNYAWIQSGQSIIPGIRGGMEYTVQAYYNGRWQPEWNDAGGYYRVTIPMDYRLGSIIDVNFNVEMNCQN